MLTPLDRIRRDLALKGIPLSMGYLVSQIERAADLLDPIDGEHWKQLLASDWMATDATGLKVLVPKLPEAHNGGFEPFGFAPPLGGRVPSAPWKSIGATTRWSSSTKPRRAARPWPASSSPSRASW